MEQVAKFLKEADTYYLATVEGDQPRVRPFGTAHIFEGKLYIQTGKSKAVSKQIHANPKVEICAFKDGEWLRVQANLLRMTAERRDSRCSTHIRPCRRCTLRMMATQKYFILRMRQLYFLHLHRNRRL